MAYKRKETRLGWDAWKQAKNVQLTSETNMCTQATSPKPYIAAYNVMSILMQLSQAIQVFMCYNAALFVQNCGSE